MKCRYCGGPLNLEDAYCPHCGKPNELAKRHIRDMQQFRGEFEETKEEVIRQTRRISAVSVRIALISVMIVLSILCYIFGSNAWSMIRNAGRRNSRANAEEHLARIEEMLQNEEYRDLAAYIEYWNIDIWSDEYEHISRVLQASRSYAYAYDDMLRFAFPGEYESRSRTMESLGGDLSSFTDVLSRETYGESGEDKAREDAVMEKMSRDLAKYLVAWCGVSREDAERFFTLTSARQAVILEEAWEDEEE